MKSLASHPPQGKYIMWDNEAAVYPLNWIVSLVTTEGSVYQIDNVLFYKIQEAIDFVSSVMYEFDQSLARGDAIFEIHII